MIQRVGASLFLAMTIVLTGWAGTAKAGMAFMPTGGRTTQPIGHYDFCQREPRECRQTTPGQADIVLSRELWSAMVTVNDAVNTTVEPRTDMDIWGTEEFWSYPDGVGDCEDYALEKRRRLMQMGVPARNLLITVARQPNGDGHAVLTVRTDGGDFILDNLDPNVRPWSQTPYTYLKRQSERHSGAWVAIDDARANIAVGSVK